MLTQVDVTTAFGTLFSFPLYDISEGYTVKDIDGLDPVKATLVYSSFAGQDGSQFQSARRENRNLVLKLGYEPDYALTTVQALRSKLYKGFMPKSVVKLKFYEDTGLIVYINGRVESFDSPRFTKDPDGTISIICEVPDFDTLVTLTQSGMSTTGTTTTDFEYGGSVETGFLFTLNVDRVMSGFTLYNTDASNTQRVMPFVAPMEAGDILKISTVPGNKYALLNRLGVDESVMYGVSSGANWLNLFPGLNKIRVLASGAAVPWTIDYTTKYGGL